MYAFTIHNVCINIYTISDRGTEMTAEPIAIFLHFTLKKDEISTKFRIIVYPNQSYSLHNSFMSYLLLILTLIGTKLSPMFEGF